MAQFEYITKADMRYKPVKRAIDSSSDPDYFQEYIDTANDWYEDYAQRVGVSVDDLQTPIPMQAKEVLQYYAVWKYASEISGLNEQSITTEDIYVNMANKAYKYWRELKMQLTKEYITGTVENRSNRAISMGRIYRG